ncbi:hypothetical protein OQZ33_20830 [Pedobacter sp. MC2016-05]|uniref:DUF6688 domain-containing protein n=1 Tax=Pedobacter sp. MC2016-05 TaxID=2994474 RepID=UPI002245DFAA|nr:DUF6688 family protein [Pedobacter sp. MC2016-05]MCX2476790.1 hypothetical protein [Pedobacter sp. MC2016-05]
MTVIIILFFIICPVVGYFFYKTLRQNAKPAIVVGEFIFISLFILSAGLFGLGWLINGDDYYDAIDPVDGGYTPFASRHLPTLLVFFVLAVFGLIKLWYKGRSLPPLLFSLFVVFVIIGIPISIAVIMQASTNTEQSGETFLFALLPFSYIVTAVVVLTKIVIAEAGTANTKTYRNKFLNYLNQKLAKTGRQPLLIFAMLIPVFAIIVAILMLFGQDANSITKVFTETTTWAFSQKTHPPFLDHNGHYLCTVAVCGTPSIVKPLRLGKRHGHEIIVNRQLLIANAFEELIQENAPRLHKVIRDFYDKYGYPLSRKITTAKASNAVYILMKPLEYFFLMVLYLCSAKPEEKINKQYEI